MKRPSFPGAMLGCMLLSTTALTAPALAQSVPMPPLHSAVDDNGVDMLSGTMAISEDDLSIGPAGAGGLSHHRFMVSGGWSHGWYVALVQPVPTHTDIAIGTRSMSFTKTGTIWVSDQQNGATLVATTNGFTLTDADGTVYLFDKAPMANGASYNNYHGAAVATSITAPNGLNVTLSYQRSSFFSFGSTVWAVRLVSVSTNAGYQLTYTHGSAALTGYSDLGTWWDIAKVTAVNAAVDYCDPTATSCSSLTQPGRAVTYSAGTAPDSSPSFDVTGPTGLVRQYYSTTTALVIRQPTGDTRSYTTDENGYVTNFSDGASNWAYSWYPNGDFLSGQRTDPLNHTILTYAHVPGSHLQSFSDGLGHQTNYEYDAYGRLTKVTAPEGNYVLYTYDTRGNVTQTTAMAKGGTASLSSSSTFPSSCTSAATCNLPVTTTDARGNVTDYGYSNGLLASVTAPAETPGAARAQVRYSYSPLYAYQKNSAGSIVAASTPIYKVTEASICSSGSTCAGTASETKTTVSYGTVGVANNLLPTSSTVAAGDASLSVTTATTYDYAGDVSSVDGPLSGAADSSLLIHDLSRRVTEAVSPDPDGPTGSLKSQANVYTYDASGRVTAVTSGTSNADGSGFAGTVQAATAYDAQGRKAKQMAVGGATIYSAVQYSYDAAGNLDCTAQRMTPGTYATLPEACALSTPGGDDPDRITRNGYDAADRLTTVTTAYRTPLQSVDATNSYNNNDTLETFTDGEGNKTSYIYDGFDRLSQTRYPSATQGAHASNPADYEQLTYDDNGNVTARRLRNGHSLTYGYDALNRITVKSITGSPTGASPYSVYYGHDLRGLMTYARFGSASGSGITNTYDALGRLTSETSTMSGSSRTVTSEYDIAGRRTRVVYPAANFAPYGTQTLSLRYLYDVMDRLTATTYNNGNAVAGWIYNDAGQVSALTRFGATITSLGYDGADRLNSITHELPGTAADISLGYDYNSAYQITQNRRSNDSYAWGGHYNFSRSYSANGLNQYAVSGPLSLGYDGNGNLISDGSNGFAYDDENKLVSVSGAHSATLSYDPLGRLWQLSAGSVVTQFAYDGDKLLMELDGSGNEQQAYVHGTGADTPVIWFPGNGVGRFLESDNQGSIIAAANASGSYVAVNSYDEYGIPASTNSGRFQYTGQIWLPELGLYYYKARMYSPTLGRFMQTDPIGYGDGANAYSYVHADPANGTDPTGLDDVTIWGPRFARFGVQVGLFAPPSTGDGQERDLNQQAAEAHAVESRRRQNAIVVTARREARYLRGAVITALIQACGGCRIDPNNFVPLNPNFVRVIDPRKLPRSFQPSISSHGGAFSARIPGSEFILKYYLHDSDNGDMSTITISTSLTDPRHYIDFLLSYQMGDPINSYYARQYCFEVGIC